MSMNDYERRGAEGAVRAPETARGWLRRSKALVGIAVGAVLIGAVLGLPRIRPVHAQTTRFVAVGGNDMGGTNDCSNSAQPCATIQNAVNQSTVGDLIQLGPGTYFENVSIEGPTFPPNDVTIQGDLTTGSTVNGNGVGPVFLVGGSHTATFKNLTITNGNAGDATGNAGGAITSGGDTTITVVGCTITGNAATGTENAGGAIYNANDGTLTIINSTITSNTAEFGGAIQNQGTTTLVNTTITGNTASSEGGGGISNATGTLNFTNTIIAGNTGGDIVGNGAIGTNDHNLVQDGSGSAALSGDPKLGPLQNNGGPTSTQALLQGSPAINAGDNAVTGGPLDLTTDQRGTGFPREYCGHVDIGAFEALAPFLTVPASITVNSDPGNCSASVTLSASATDVCDGTIAPTYKIGNTVITSPHSFPVGTTTVTASATNTSGSTSTASFTVTVNDTSGPLLSCPANIAATSAPGKTSALVSFAATATDGCDGAIAPVFKIGNTVISSPYNFPAGVTTVHVSATDSHSLTTSCSFTVTVVLLNVCIQDDHTGDTFRFNSTTGQYVYTRCKDGFTLTGTGTVRTANGQQTLTVNGSNIKVNAAANTGSLTGRANVTLIPAPGVYQVIVVNQTNPAATCTCPGTGS